MPSKKVKASEGVKKPIKTKSKEEKPRAKKEIVENEKKKGKKTK